MRNKTTKRKLTGNAAMIARGKHPVMVYLDKASMKKLRFVAERNGRKPSSMAAMLLTAAVADAVVIH